jgi:hypothetical protein
MAGGRVGAGCEQTRMGASGAERVDQCRANSREQSHESEPIKMGPDGR